MMNVLQAHQIGRQQKIVHMQKNIAIAGLKTREDAALKLVDLVC